MIILILAVFGLCLGSFVNALIWRVNRRLTDKNSKYSVFNGRSVCPNCKHQLAARDLIPLLSWLVLRGRCRYCGKPISVQYPLVEAATALIFVLSYTFWPQTLQGGQWLLFIAWGLTSVGLMALLVYDSRWQLLPNKILYPTLAVAVAGRLAFIMLQSSDKTSNLEQWALSVLIASGVFWLLYTLSKGRWIGYGDVRLGLITGTVLAKPDLSFLMIFLASVIGLIFVLPSLISHKTNLSTRIPFGPFLIVATFIALLFGQEIIDWYRRLFLL